MAYRIPPGGKTASAPPMRSGYSRWRMGDWRRYPIPSESLLVQYRRTLPTCVTCVMEGVRPVLAEIQAWWCPSSFGNPRRIKQRRGVQPGHASAGCTGEAGRIAAGKLRCLSQRHWGPVPGRACRGSGRHAGTGFQLSGTSLCPAIWPPSARWALTGELRAVSQSGPAPVRGVRRLGFSSV